MTQDILTSLLIGLRGIANENGLVPVNLMLSLGACHVYHSQSMQYDAITVSLHHFPEFGTPHWMLELCTDIYFKSFILCWYLVAEKM